MSEIKAGDTVRYIGDFDETLLGDTGIVKHVMGAGTDYAFAHVNFGGELVSCAFSSLELVETAAPKPQSMSAVSFFSALCDILGRNENATDEDAVVHRVKAIQDANSIAADVIARQQVEIERLKASNAELRACADEAQAARLAAVAEAAAMRRAIETWRTIGTDDDHYSHDELEVIIDDLAKSVNGNAGAALLERLAAAESRVKALEEAAHAVVEDCEAVGIYPISLAQLKVLTAADALKGDAE